MPTLFILRVKQGCHKTFNLERFETITYKNLEFEQKSSKNLELLHVK